jgi:putative transposase
MGRTSSAVYNINYHIVWCPKYRRGILKDKVEEFLKSCLQTICETKKWKLLEMEVMPDHIHIFISAPPFDAPTDIVKVLKGVTARRLFMEFPQLKKKLWKGSLWSPSYYVGTAGHVSAETIKRYIEEQKSNSSTQ